MNNKMKELQEEIESKNNNVNKLQNEISDVTNLLKEEINKETKYLTEVLIGNVSELILLINNNGFVFKDIHIHNDEYNETRENKNLNIDIILKKKYFRNRVNKWYEATVFVSPLSGNIEIKNEYYLPLEMEQDAQNFIETVLIPFCDEKRDCKLTHLEIWD